MRRRGRIFAVLFIASGTAFLGLLTGGEHLPVRAAEDPMMRFWPVPMPTYPGTTMRPVAPDQRVGSSALKMAYFTTTDSPAKVGDFYAAEWRTAGHHVTEDVTFKGGSVSGYDAVAGMMRQVVMMHKDGRTLVFPAVASEPLKLLDRSAVPADIPVYPGAMGLLVTQARDPLARSQVVTYMDDGPLEANLNFYKGEMQRRGWVDETKPLPAKFQADDAHILVYTSGGAEMTVNLLKLDETRTRVHVTLVR
ncbi:MAG: hypothetical protein HY906_07640 [Deltaproteobacteria bacterium]|nr:hypothetical protein [Deltaproteobacteria bacterium]